MVGGFAARIAHGNCSVCRRHTQREGLGKFLQRSSHSESICVRLRPIESLCLGNVTHGLDFRRARLRAPAANCEPCGLPASFSASTTLLSKNQCSMLDVGLGGSALCC